MEQKRTDKKLLVKGLQNLMICFALMFIGPTLLYMAFSNQSEPTYVIVLSIALIVCACAIFFLFRGILILLRSIF